MSEHSLDKLDDFEELETLHIILKLFFIKEENHTEYKSEKKRGRPKK